MTDQLPHPTCPDCGDPLPPDSPQALCPACLMRQALASRTIAGGGNPLSPPLTPDEIADKFPGFEILECLGRGGMGVVYKARQKSLDRLVAIKILPPERAGEEKFAERFAREAQTLARLNHPNIVTVFDHGQAGGLFYIVMEFVDGVNLRDLLRDGKLEPKQALAIIPPVCDALQFAHDKGIVHRDIKPENLLLDKEGRVKIADFGIAKLMDAAAADTRSPDGEDQRRAQTGATMQAGTRGYSAPEQSGGPADHRSDIYALGVVLYEMLTGSRPDKDVVAPSRKVQLDVRIDEIVLRALEKNPALRYQQASDVKTMVETIVSDPGSARDSRAVSGDPAGNIPTRPGEAGNQSGEARALPSRKDWRPILVTIAVHTVLLLILSAILLLVVPKFVAVFNGLALPLPVSTRAVIGLARFAQLGGFLLVPAVIAADILICWGAQRIGGRKPLVWWAVLGALGLAAPVAAIAVCVFHDIRDTARSGSPQTAPAPIIETRIRFVEMPADAPFEAGKLDFEALSKMQGVDVLSAPAIHLVSGKEGQIKVLRDTGTGAFTPAPVGVTARFLAKLDGDTVHYSVKLSVCSRLAGEEAGRTITRELTRSGDAGLDRPVVLDMGRDDNGRRLVTCLEFHR